MKINSRWAFLGWLAAGQLLGKARQNALETLQIYGAAAYLKGVRLVRDFFIHQIGVLTCVMFLVFGVVLIEGAAVFALVQRVSPAVTILIAGLLNFSVGLSLLGYFASSRCWLEKASRYNAYLNALLHEENPEIYRNCRPRERNVHSRQ